MNCTLKTNQSDQKLESKLSDEGRWKSMAKQRKLRQKKSRDFLFYEHTLEYLDIVENQLTSH